MITRIKINGFKSLVDTELFFGPFTCIAGENAVGKSNFFDALMFLSKLADTTIIEAVKSIRSEDQKHTNFSDVFFKSNGENVKSMDFEIDLILPKQSEDDFGQLATATITTVCYKLKLTLNEDSISNNPIRIVYEELTPIAQTEVKKSLKFKFEKQWLDSVLIGKRSSAAPFISTSDNKIKLHQDGNKGRTTDFIPEKMPRTLLSSATAESPTAFIVRQEMRTWMMLQFEPSALRKSNSIVEVMNSKIAANGLNLPAALYRLALEKIDIDIYQLLTNKIKDLVENVDEILLDYDEKRDLISLQIKFKGGLILPAQSLSDGTLRFLGLAIIEEDSHGSGLICLEEPENGINPKKIEHIVRLLEEMVTDTEFEVDGENLLRQVFINTHSPIVVSSVSDESLYLAKNQEIFSTDFNRKVRCTQFTALAQTWKTTHELAQTTSNSEISFYLSEIKSEYILPTPQSSVVLSNHKKTVKENLQQFKLDFPINE